MPLRRTLAELCDSPACFRLISPVVAERDLPASDITAMDGYALGPASALAAERGEELTVDGTVGAGARPAAGPLRAGSARKVMTGAPIPEGADRVAPFEHTDRGTTRVRLHRVPSEGANIRRQGEVALLGTVVLHAGEKLTAGRRATAAMVGARQLEVAPLPSVSFLVTGDEVVPFDAEPETAQVRDTHGPFLTAALAGLGIPARSLGIVRDDPAALEAALSSAFADDVVIATGGVSAGEFDFVEPAVERLGGRWLFDGIAMQPGKPLVAAETERGFFIGLPGNPASAMVGWWLIVRPLLHALAGAPVLPAWAAARLVELGGPTPGAHDRDRFLPATLTLVRGRSVATPLATRGSHDLPAYARAQALIRIRAGDSARAAGATVEALELREMGED